VSGSEWWEDNSIQFPRLITEIGMARLTREQAEKVCFNMGIALPQLGELFDRACKERESAMRKTPT
jgi:hypothetical protein